MLENIYFALALNSVNTGDVYILHEVKSVREEFQQVMAHEKFFMQNKLKKKNSNLFQFLLPSLGLRLLYLFITNTLSLPIH